MSTLPHRRRSLLAGCLLTVTTLLAASACGGSMEARSADRRSTLVIAENEPPASFDPVQADNSTVDEVVIPAYDSLVQYDGHNKLRGQLARTWKPAPDGRSVTFTLRDDVTFHDGTKLTAHDVRYTLDRIKKLGTGVASQLDAYRSTEVIDDTHLTIRLKQPFAPFLAILSRVYILNADLVKKHAGSDNGQTWLGDNDAGSGPYRLTSYTPNQRASFTRYDTYWGGQRSQAREVVFTYVADSSTQRALLMSGDVDIAMDINPFDWKALASDKRYVVDKANTLVQLYAFFNTQKGPTADRRVRKAISLAYDYTSHVKNILHGAGHRAHGPLPTAMPCHTASVPQPAFDLDEARRLLKQAGHPHLKLHMAYLTAIDEEDRAGTLLQSTLRKIGVDLQLDATTFPQYTEEIKKVSTTPDLGMTYAFPAYPDPDAVLSINFDSTYIGNGYNYASYKNVRVDSLVRRAQTAIDQKKRCELYGKAQKLIAEDYVALNISNPQYVTVLRSGLTGYQYRQAHHQTVDVNAIQLDH